MWLKAIICLEMDGHYNASALYGSCMYISCWNMQSERSMFSCCDSVSLKFFFITLAIMGLLNQKRFVVFLKEKTMSNKA